MNESRLADPMRCFWCDSAEHLGGPTIPGGADHVCRNCGAQFDMVDGMVAGIGGDPAKQVPRSVQRRLAHQRGEPIPRFGGKK